MLPNMGSCVDGFYKHNFQRPALTYLKQGVHTRMCISLKAYIPFVYNFGSYRQTWRCTICGKSPEIILVNFLLLA